MISVVIRVKNEMKTLPRLVEALKRQTYGNFEIVVVDNESTDGSYEYAKKVADKVVMIEDFTYSKASNLGVEHSKGELVYFVSGHCLPIHEEMFEGGIDILKHHKDVVGVYGRNVSDPERANLMEKMMSKWDEMVWPKGFKMVNHWRPGILQTTTALIRREALLKDPFREMVTNGGEDALWAVERLKGGWKIAYDPLFDVYHSHGGSVWKTLKLYASWQLMNGEIFVRKNEVFW